MSLGQSFVLAIAFLGVLLLFCAMCIGIIALVALVVPSPYDMLVSIIIIVLPIATGLIYYTTN